MLVRRRPARSICAPRIILSTEPPLCGWVCRSYCFGVYDRTLKTEAGAPTSGPSPTRSQVAVSHASQGGRSVVVLGAGLCAGPAVEMLSRTPENTVHVVSSLAGEAEALCAEVVGRSNCVPHVLDVSGARASAPPLSALIAEADAVLSLLPATMHVPIAVQCIASRTPLVTASYVSPELEALHAELEAPGVDMSHITQVPQSPTGGLDRPVRAPRCPFA